MVNRSFSGRFARKPDTEVDRRTSTRPKRARRELEDSDPNKANAGSSLERSNDDPYDLSTIKSPPKKKSLRSRGPIEPLTDVPVKLRSAHSALGRLPTRPKKVTQPLQNGPADQDAPTPQSEHKPQRRIILPARPARSVPLKRKNLEHRVRKKVKLDRPNEPPSTAAKPADGADKRTLRSAAGTSRSKSGLAQFFPDFEEHVFGPEKEPAYINVDSILFLTKDTRNPDDKAAGLRSPTKAAKQTLPKSPKLSNARLKNPKTPTKSTDFETVDLDAFKEDARKFDTDPLADDVFAVAHRRGERKEKQMRNIEKEYARHERNELERLLDELQGPDWLRAMGISGVTETEKRSYEPKRDYYIDGVKNLLRKFVTWDQQEKVLKLKREQKAAAQREMQMEEADEDETTEVDADERMEDSSLEIPDSEIDTIPPSDSGG